MESIKKVLVAELKKHNFFDQVIGKFTGVDRTAELILSNQ
jgi:hypothetical protein